MRRLLTSAFAVLAVTGSAAALAQEVTVEVTGSVWDSDSRGFAYYQGLTVAQGTKKAARRGSRVSVDGRPDRFAISGEGGAFALRFTTAEPTFRLVVEGDRFPRTITQPYVVPEGGGEIDVERVYTPRAEGAEHTWPLPMVAAALGYGSTHELLADDKAAIRILLYGSGADGAPEWTDQAKISFPSGGTSGPGVERTSTSPFLMRVPRSEYVIPFDMNPRDTYFLLDAPNTGAFIVIVSFEPGEGADKEVIMMIEDTVTDELLDPPRPWRFSPKAVLVRNGFATEVRYEPDIE